MSSVHCNIPSTLCLPHLRVELSCELRALATTFTCFAGVACQLWALVLYTAACAELYLSSSLVPARAPPGV